VAIGEFHIKGEQADFPVVRRMVELARDHRLLLHVHGDAESIERLFRQDPLARIVWAHGGFESIVYVRELLRRFAHLWVELSSRGDVTHEGRLAPAWRELLMEFPDRFMVGTDTDSPARWLKIAPVSEATRTWLAELPADVAERIAYKNGEAVLTDRFRASAAPVELSSPGHR
jgi:hypothetical protein